MPYNSPHVHISVFFFYSDRNTRIEEKMFRGHRTQKTIEEYLYRVICAYEQSTKPNFYRIHTQHERVCVVCVLCTIDMNAVCVLQPVCEC